MITVSKKGAVELLRQETGYSKKVCAMFYDAFINTVIDTLRDENAFSARGAFTFRPYHRKATTKRNPRTGEQLNIPARTAVKCVFGTSIKEALKKS